MLQSHTDMPQLQRGKSPWLQRGLTDRHLRPVCRTEGAQRRGKCLFTPVGSEVGRGSNLFAHPQLHQPGLTRYSTSTLPSRLRLPLPRLLDPAILEPVPHTLTRTHTLLPHISVTASGELGHPVLVVQAPRRIPRRCRRKLPFPWGGGGNHLGTKSAVAQTAPALIRPHTSLSVPASGELGKIRVLVSQAPRHTP